MIRLYDEAGSVIETHEHAGDFKAFFLYDLSLMVEQKAPCENLVKESRALFAWHAKNNLTIQ